MNEIIDADDPRTWPAALIATFRESTSTIGAYQDERRRIQRLLQEDELLRFNSPQNLHREAWNAILRRVNASIRGKFLKGYHATRLTKGEQDEIKSRGLEVLSVALLERRLAAARIADHVTESDHTALLAQHQAAEDSRSGKIWFVFSRALLCDESGMIRLFRS